MNTRLEVFFGAVAMLVMCGVGGGPALPDRDAIVRTAGATTVRQGSVARAYDDGHFAFLVVHRGADSVRLAVSKEWGGTIVELSMNGTNFVNGFDPGREIQPSFYDGNAHYDQCSGCTSAFGWNPVMAGDRHGTGSRAEAMTHEGTVLYARTWALMWRPEAFGGGPGKPVTSDVRIEQWVSSLEGHWNAFRIHYRVVHAGQDLHANALQEFPAVFVNRENRLLIYYGGSEPWGNGPLTRVDLATTKKHHAVIPLSERWISIVNQSDVGIGVSSRGQFPFGIVSTLDGTSGPLGRGATYFAPLVPRTFFPSDTLDDDVYVALGTPEEIRNVFSDIHRRELDPDVFPPLGHVDLPRDSQTVEGVFGVAGWGLDDSGVSSADAMVDGQTPAATHLQYGVPRPDVGAQYPGVPVNVGFAGQVHVGGLAPGWHDLEVRLVDTAGHVAVLRRVPFRVTR